MFIKHQLTKIPQDIRKETVIITILGIITSFGFDALSFLLQFGKTAIASGRIVLGITLICLYYVKNTLDASVSLWMDDITATYREHYNMSIYNKIVDVLMKVRGKVWRINPETNSNELMSTNAVIISSKSYISMIWDIKTMMPRHIFQVISVICMFIGFVMVTSFEIEHVTLFISIIIIVSIMSVVFSINRNKLRRRFRKARKGAEEEKANALNDALNLEPINSKHAKYMTENFIRNSKKIYSFDKKDRKATNKVSVLESFMDSLATITIIWIKIIETGLKNVDLNVVLSIVALVAIYVQIMNKINSIIHIFEDVKRSLEEIKNYESDFKAIIKALDAETDVKEYGTIESVTIPKFLVKYKAIGEETPFSLENNQVIKLVPNDIVLLTGPTGSGKSTFMKMVTGKIKFDDFELLYRREKNGVINSVMHQTDGRLGSKTVFSELTFDVKPDEEKLLHILRGLHLYDEISEKNSDVISYLKASHVEDYSSGQKQRLAIARLLYNLDDTVQIIGFDEATNALNDEITMQTLNFIKTYCTGKILLIATHQVDIGETVATRKFEFVASGDKYVIK